MEQSVQQAREEVIGLGEDWRLVEALLPDRWMEMARELGAFQRVRGIADARALPTPHRAKWQFLLKSAHAFRHCPTPR